MTTYRSYQFYDLVTKYCDIFFLTIDSVILFFLIGFDEASMLEKIRYQETEDRLQVTESN